MTYLCDKCSGEMTFLGSESRWTDHLELDSGQYEASYLTFEVYTCQLNHVKVVIADDDPQRMNTDEGRG